MCLIRKNLSWTPCTCSGLRTLQMPRGIDRRSVSIQSHVIIPPLGAQLLTMLFPDWGISYKVSTRTEGKATTPHLDNAPRRNQVNYFIASTIQGWLRSGNLQWPTVLYRGKYICLDWPLKAIMFVSSYVCMATHHRTIWSSCLRIFPIISLLAIGAEWRSLVRCSNDLDEPKTTKDGWYWRTEQWQTTAMPKTKYR